MSMVKVKTAELTGQALDLAVAQAVKPEGFVLRDSGGEIDPPWVLGLVKIPSEQQCRILEINRDELNIDELPLRCVWSPSTNWSQGGPLRDEFNVGIEPGSASDGRRYAYVPGRELDGSFGETALIAICRAIVAAKLGDEVEVPQDLTCVI